MYILPQKYACKKCGLEVQWTPGDHELTPRVYIEKYPQPICPKCWNDWLLENFQTMERKK